MDLSRPYDQRRITSFQSSLSSNTHLDMDTPVRASRELERPKTPREVRLHFPLDAQCSPIPGIPEEQGECEVDPRMVIDGMMSCAPKNRSDSVTSDSTNAKLRRLRPMPDMAAFESGTSSSRVDRSNDDSATTLDSKGGHISPRLNCPPTPVRTPAWANESLIKHHPFLGARQNSLIATKVLLSCPSQVLEGRSSLESSVLDDDSKSGGLLGGSHANDNADTRFSQLPEYHSGRKANVSGADSSSGQEPTVKTPNSSRLSGPLVSFSNDFDTLASLGSGAFADVFKVRLKRDNRLYAVKRNRRQFRGKRDRDMALAEVQSMQRLQSVCAETSGSGGGRNEKNSYSLYLLFFYRAWQEDGYFLCQTELCCRDTCRELLDSLRFNWNTAKEKYPSLLRNLSAGAKVVPGSYFDTGGRLVPSMTIWKVCHDVAAGLSHIHSHGIVHHDIKPSNIFFVEHARFGAMCKIGDFGMAGDVGSTGDGQEGDAKYMPPELLSSGERHPSSDIFSLGLTLYELATDQQMELPSEGPKWHGLRSDHAPELPKCREPELVEMIKLMTSTSEEKRPTADTILKNDTVISAGHGCDKLLRDYIQDIEGFDKEEEERLAMDHNEDQTPQTGHLRSGVPVRSPSLSMLLPMAPNLLSPAARDMN
jgi:membrane-associated tyrosine/threonine-specific cdc2-inhibitory kinase